MFKNAKRKKIIWVIIFIICTVILTGCDPHITK